LGREHGGGCRNLPRMLRCGRKYAPNLPPTASFADHEAGSEVFDRRPHRLLKNGAIKIKDKGEET
jgi:hypothetical protein